MKSISQRMLSKMLKKGTLYRVTCASINQSINLHTPFESNKTDRLIDQKVLTRQDDLYEEEEQTHQEKTTPRPYEILTSIKINSSADINTVQKIKSLLSLEDEKTMKIFDFVCEESNLEKTLKLFKTQNNFDIGFVNLIASFFGSKFIFQDFKEKRKPIISIMGHVDHGKTTLLDYFRNTRKASNEVGGITQKIGGFTMNTKYGELSFIDTPGHAIFSNMRKTGAFLADIVVVIISAIEGIQPQTNEVLDLIREYKLPFIVAINKIDKEGSDPEAVEESLVERGIDLEPYGGTVPVIHISAKNGKNAELLLELLAEEAARLDLKADSSLYPECLILETAVSTDSNFKKTSAVIKNGTVKNGACLTYGNTYFKVMRIMDDLGRIVEKASPGDIVEIAGISEYPKSTEKMIGVSNESNARLFVELNQKIKDNFFKEEVELIYSDYKIKFETRREKRKFIGNTRYQQIKLKDTLGDLNVQMQTQVEKALSLSDNPESLEENELIQQSLKRKADGLAFMIDQMEGKSVKNPILIKVSNMGTKDTILEWMNKTENKNFTVCEISCGQITEHDIKMCKELGAKIVVFDLLTTTEVDKMVKEAGISLVSHNIIYKLFEELSNWRSGSDDPFDAKFIAKGKGLVKKVFKFMDEKGKQIQIAGCVVNEGAFNKSNIFRILRRGKLVANNLKVSSLKRFKAEVSVVKEGQDTGISFLNHHQFEEGDIIEAS